MTVMTGCKVPWMLGDNDVEFRYSEGSKNLIMTLGMASWRRNARFGLREATGIVELEFFNPGYLHVGGHDESGQLERIGYTDATPPLNYQLGMSVEEAFRPYNEEWDRTGFAPFSRFYWADPKPWRNREWEREGLKDVILNSGSKAPPRFHYLVMGEDMYLEVMASGYRWTLFETDWFEGKQCHRLEEPVRVAEGEGTQ